MNIPSGTASASRLPRRLVGIIPFLRTNNRCFFNRILLEVEVCEFSSSFPLLYLFLNV
jgi:hypothetical protein